jgi:hypothetical protein
VAEALYRSWTHGVSLFTWFLIRDNPETAGAGFPDTFQSGLFFACARAISCDRPKPSMQAFRFPFVAYKRSGNRVLVWGRTPFGRRGRVTIEQKGRKLARLKTNRNGLFTKTLRRKGNGDLRARFGRERSVPFSLTEPPDRPGNPFG